MEKRVKMLLSLSNLCSSDNQLINSLPIDRVETVYHRVGLDNYNKPIVAAQSLFYNQSTTIFNPGFLPQYKRVIDNLEKNKINIAVFGSPDVRNEGKSNRQLANAAIRYMGEYALDKGVMLAVEPIAKHYKGEFLNTIEQIVALADQFPERIPFMVNFDIGNVWLEEGKKIFDIIEKYSKFFAHTHISAINLKPINEETEIPYDEILACLKESDYDKLSKVYPSLEKAISIEMKPTTEDNIKATVELVKNLL